MGVWVCISVCVRVCDYVSKYCAVCGSGAVCVWLSVEHGRDECVYEYVSK